VNLEIFFDTTTGIEITIKKMEPRRCGVSEKG
jgi:hypothetical protein